MAAKELEEELTKLELSLAAKDSKITALEAQLAELEASTGSGTRKLDRSLSQRAARSLAKESDLLEVGEVSLLYKEFAAIAAESEDPTLIQRSQFECVLEKVRATAAAAAAAPSTTAPYSFSLKNFLLTSRSSFSPNADHGLAQYRLALRRTPSPSLRGLRRWAYGRARLPRVRAGHGGNVPRLRTRQVPALL